MPVLQIIFASTSGHTEHVIDTLIGALSVKASKLTIEKQRAETSQPEDLLKGDILLLACGTWNTGGTEGQLNLHMHSLLKERAAAIDLQGKPCAVIALGDDRYYYTGRAMEHLIQFVTRHKGKLLESLIIINEPYGQEKKIEKWGGRLLQHFPQGM